MIGPMGPPSNLLRQYELGAVPAEIAHEEDVARGPHDGQDEERAKKSRKGTRRRWLRFLHRR
jgi:hypothetical protein